jgi:uncharacterized protein
VDFIENYYGLNSEGQKTSLKIRSGEVAQSAKYLLVGSIEAYSGKSTAILGIIHRLKKQGIKTAYGKPIGTFADECLMTMNEQNISFLADNLDLSQKQLHLPLLNLSDETIINRLTEDNSQNYTQQLKDYVAKIQSPFTLIEGPNTLWEGSFFELSIGEMAATIDAPILLITRYSSLSLVANLINAKRFLQERLLGVVINDIPETELSRVKKFAIPYLEKRHISVLGIIPKDRLLNSISVRELSQRLNAKVLCRRDRLNLMVEGLTIGAMNVNSALEYFRQKTNMVVVTGSDRTDLQMAALETSTNCLILTGHVAPQPFILSRAEDLEIPILAVDSDTLTTVEIVDRAFGKVPINEPIKVKQVIQLMEKHFDFERLIDLLDLEAPLTV